MTMKSKEVLGVGVALSTLVTSRSIFAQTDRTHMCCSEPLGTEPKNFARGAVKCSYHSTWWSVAMALPARLYPDYIRAGLR